MTERPQEEVKREFGLSSLSINNATSVFILVFIITGFGLFSYISMPKEQFPEIVLPNIYINTIYPGNSPVDMENLITRPIEKEIKSLKGVKKITSTSLQDVSIIIVEFNEDVEASDALIDVKDAVDKAKSELPTDLDEDPMVMELDFSEIPIVMINLSGDFEIDKLKDYAEYLEDKIEALPEVSKVDIIGALDREIQINADPFYMAASNVTFGDIEGAIASENITASAGDVLINGFRRSIRIPGEFNNVEELENVIVKSEKGRPVYLKDIAEVKDSYVERYSYSRLATSNFLKEGNYPVVSLRVVKKTGENLINASEEIDKLLEKAKKEYLPSKLNIVLTEDQADDMKTQISNLENSIISGVILVVIVLLFFMGLRNALFVGIAIPLSMFMSFMILGSLGVTINMVVLFGLILALGMLVDNAIVVIENIYRLMEQGYSPMKAAKEGVGEVAVAIISSTATTLAAFVPLAFWGGIMGEFMKYLPITLIVVLASSLFVGLVINPVIAFKYMKVDNSPKIKNKKLLTIAGIALIAVAIPLYLRANSYSLPNILTTLALIILANAYFFKPAAYWFQNELLTRLEKIYLSTLRFALTGKKPLIFFGGAFVFLFLSMILFISNAPKVVFFPTSDPNYVFINIEAPIGTDAAQTDSITRAIEKDVFELLKPYRSIIKSIVSNVGENTGSPNEGPAQETTPNKSKIAIGFKPFEKRGNISTVEIKKKVTEYATTLDGLVVNVAQDEGGPPTGKPINIEVTGEDYQTLIQEAEKIKNIVASSQIPGITGLKLGLDINKPEMLVNINRSKARRYGVSTGMVSGLLRTAVYGKEVSKFKDGEDDYPIQLRLKKEYRYNPSTLKETTLIFRDNQGQLHNVPISSIADFEIGSTIGSVKRKDLDRMIAVMADVSEGYNANEIVAGLKQILELHKEKMPDGYNFKFTGEQEEQQKSMEFLLKAMLIAVAAIFLILVSQFNSAIRPFIIICSVIFSLIGVLLGLFIFGDEFVIIMTGVGIISLAGVVVNNAIVLIDYVDLLRKRKKKERGLSNDDHLPTKDFIDCLVEGGATRLRPVLLTAITTILGLIPLAVGLNIDFFGLFSKFEPGIYIGGSNADIWGPMAWTVIYGLVFSTFLTLVIVPVMYLLSDNIIQLMGRVSKKLSPSSK